MSITAEHIRDKLMKELSAVHVGKMGRMATFGQPWLTTVAEVQDTSPDRCAASFKVLVVSAQFEGKSLLQRHRMVNSCLAEELKEIHAFEQKTITPEQLEKQQSQ